MSGGRHQPPACAERGGGIGSSRPLHSNGEPESWGAFREPVGCGTPRFLKALRSYRFRHRRPTPLGSISDYNGGPCNQWLRLTNLVHRSRERCANEKPRVSGLRELSAEI